MFEFDQDIVEELLGGDERFQELYQQHATLKTRVHEAEIGIHPLDDLAERGKAVVQVRLILSS